MTPPSIAYDTLTITLQSPYGTLQQTLLTVSNLSRRNQWTGYSQILPVPAAWQGQSLWLQFTAKTDGSLPSTFYIDETNLTFTCTGPTEPRGPTLNVRVKPRSAKP